MRQLKQLEILIELLSERVGSTINYSSLAQDLEVSPHTIKRWVGILESLYVIFVVRPYTKKMTKALRLMPKIYFWDTGQVIPDHGARLENVVATHLAKHLDFLKSTQGEKNGLYYVRDREKREVDFLVEREKKITSLIEVKTRSNQKTQALHYFKAKLKPKNTYLIIHHIKPGEVGTFQGIKHEKASSYLAKLEA